jgi:hypothetical protein
MIEYLIFDDEQNCMDVISDVKERQGNILIDFPVKFRDEKSGDIKYLFVVMEDFREQIPVAYQEDLVVSIPEELQPIDQ